MVATLSYTAIAVQQVGLVLVEPQPPIMSAKASVEQQVALELVELQALLTMASVVQQVGPVVVQFETLDLVDQSERVAAGGAGAGGGGGAEGDAAPMDADDARHSPAPASAADAAPADGAGAASAITPQRLQHSLLLVDRATRSTIRSFNALSLL